MSHTLRPETPSEREIDDMKWKYLKYMQFIQKLHTCNILTVFDCELITQNEFSHFGN